MDQALQTEQSKPSLGVGRYFSKHGEDAYGKIPWEKSDVDILGDKREVVFTQKGVEYPRTWSSFARQIVTSKYFYGEQNTPERESSVRQLIGRVIDKFGDWIGRQGYVDSPEEAQAFGDELVSLVLEQRLSWNSPVWFNVGVDRYASGRSSGQVREQYRAGEDGKAVQIAPEEEYAYPQTSACFIQSVDDTMEDIMDLARREAMLFKFGSGTGTDLSTLRSSGEKLRGGGKPSGPLGYLKFYDNVAGIVKSGGKTRRAAKMNTLRVDHPDIMEFIDAKKQEQKKMLLLMDEGGYTYEEAEATVAFQNANLSVRITDDFMHAVETDAEWQTRPVHSHDIADKMPKYKAKELQRRIAEGAWDCGDPGVQFHDTINRWHTTPNPHPINSSNPCSEYMSIDNSACNLASLNLMKFLDANGGFNVQDFRQATRVMAVSQDAEIDNSSFPTPKIAENAHRYRQLGAGYANLGAMLMSLGVPYDSDEGRTAAAAITALLTGTVYETSADMAQRLGPFEAFADNKEPMLRVMGMHKEALKGIDRTKLPRGLEGVLDAAEETWERVLEKGEQYGFRNAQATVLAPTGTIAFMMDCSTTGIEPETSHVKTKRLAGGGTIEMPNPILRPALTRLGYEEGQVEEILKYVNEHSTFEGAPGLREEHLAIFDTSLSTKKDGRTISHHGHLKMMAAVQPFISGAISKTVNLPKNTTVEEIEQIYYDAWKMGLKSVALYRDGSKRGQPLSAGKKERSQGGKLEELARGPVRHKLPTTRNSITHKFDVAEHEGYVTVGLYGDGTPGELFINMSKEGSTIGGLMDTIGTLASMALQYGVPLPAFVRKFRGQKFDPRGIVREGHPDIKTAESITDYIFTWLGKEFPNGVINPSGAPSAISEAPVDVKKKPSNSESIIDTLEERGGFCPKCEDGTRTVKKGHCMEVCPNPHCGWVDPRGCGE